MKNIYDFESREAPYISEARLAEELERRRSKKAVTAVFFSGILVEILLVICAFILYDTLALLSAFLLAYAIAGILGLTLVIVSYAKNRRAEDNGYN